MAIQQHLLRTERSIDDEWFEVLKISDGLFAISEPRHYEHTVIYLLLGTDQAILIDTGCGIGDLSNVVKQLTTLPITVINTHTHLDHLGGNRQFSDIFMFDHRRSRDIASQGAPKDSVTWELHREELVTPPWPVGFRTENSAIPPFKVSRWLNHNDVLVFGDLRLKVLHTPGEAPDHICLIELTRRILFSGDILLNGPVWSHLDGGDIRDLHESYQLLIQHQHEFDILMPSHNEPCQSKNLLPLALTASEDILAGSTRYKQGVDPWGRSYRRFDFGRISILLK